MATKAQKWRRVWLMLPQLLARLVYAVWSRRQVFPKPSPRARIYDALRQAGARGATFEEVARKEGLNTNSVRGRLSELVGEGLAVGRKRRRAVSSGRKVIVYLAFARDEGLVRPGERVEGGAASAEVR
jgi:hypothetical protein